MSRIGLERGDITLCGCDAIVNAANSSLMGGGGVDGAIHRAGGPAILAECRLLVEKRGRLPAGEAVITTAGMLPARHVIHTVGPVWRGGSCGEPRILARAYDNCLLLAAGRGLRSVAFPSISTGAYGYPVDEAAEVAVRAVAERLKISALPETVLFILYDEPAFRAYQRAVAGYGSF